MSSEKRANANFVAKCDAGTIDAYLTSQLASGRLNNAQRSELAATRTGMGMGPGMGTGMGMGMGTLRFTGGHSTGANTYSGHSTARSAGGSLGFGGASILGSLNKSHLAGGDDAGWFNTRGEAPSGRSQSRHELRMAISQMQKRLGDEKMERSRLRDNVGRRDVAAVHERPGRRIHLNMYHASTGAC